MVKFGRDLVAGHVPGWESHYLEYETLKEKLDEIVQQTAAGGDARAARYIADANQAQRRAALSDASAKWVLLLEAELRKINEFAKAKHEELKTRLSLLSRGVGDGKSPMKMPVEEAQGRASQLGQVVVDLSSFVHMNGIAIEKITKKHDKLTGLAFRPYMHARLTNEPFMTLRLDGFVLALSDIWEAIRVSNDRTLAETKGVWVPPADFARQTRKYMVAAEHVLAVEMLILPHLPVLVFGRDTSAASTIDVLARESLDLGTTYQDISSVYIDSDDLHCYHTRLERQEGARLYRLRWYGSDIVPPTGAQVFVERKTHHESWTMDDSVKERYPIAASIVVPHLVDGLSVDALIAAAVAEGSMKPPAAAKARELSTEVVQAIADLHMKPKVRTACSRTAFQSATSNAVRISLDTNLRFTREGTWDLFKVKSSVAAGWSRPIFDFPHAVLEIKLTEGQPEWVTSLLTSGMLRPIWKFSKFMSACALLRGDDTKRLPHWFHPDGRLKELWEMDPLTEEQESDTINPSVVRPIVDPAEKAAHTVVTVSEDLPAAVTAVAVVSTANTLHPAEVAPTAAVSQRLFRAASAASTTSLGASARPTVPSKSVSATAVATTGTSTASVIPPSAPQQPATTKAPPQPSSQPPSSSRSWNWPWHNWTKKPKLKPSGPKGPVKIEPKTFFANERTLLQWLSCGLLVVVMSIGILSLGSAGRIAGLAMFPVAVLMLLYALGRYLLRRHMILHRSGSAYDDVGGPVVMVAVVIAAMCVSLYFALLEPVVPFYPYGATGLPVSAHSYPVAAPGAFGFNAQVQGIALLQTPDNLTWLIAPGAGTMGVLGIDSSAQGSFFAPTSSLSAAPFRSCADGNARSIGLITTATDGSQAMSMFSLNAGSGISTIRTTDIADSLMTTGRIVSIVTVPCHSPLEIDPTMPNAFIATASQLQAVKLVKTSKKNPISAVLQLVSAQTLAWDLVTPQIVDMTLLQDESLLVLFTNSSGSQFVRRFTVPDLTPAGNWSAPGNPSWTGLASFPDSRPGLLMATLSQVWWLNWTISAGFRHSAPPATVETCPKSPLLPVPAGTTSTTGPLAKAAFLPFSSTSVFTARTNLAPALFAGRARFESVGLLASQIAAVGKDSRVRLDFLGNILLNATTVVHHLIAETVDHGQLDLWLSSPYVDPATAALNPAAVSSAAGSLRVVGMKQSVLKDTASSATWAWSALSETQLFGCATNATHSYSRVVAGSAVPTRMSNTTAAALHLQTMLKPVSGVGVVISSLQLVETLHRVTYTQNAVLDNKVPVVMSLELDYPSAARGNSPAARATLDFSQTRPAADESAGRTVLNSFLSVACWVGTSMWSIDGCSCCMQ